MKKREQFEGQKMLVLPNKIIESIEKNEFTNDLHVTDLGYFPIAKYHFRERKEGCPENILIFCTNGRGWIEVDGKREYLTKNQYFIIPKQTPHKYAADNNNPWTIYWIHFRGKKADHFVYPLNYPRMISETEDSRIDDRIQLFEEMYYNLEEEYSVNSLEYCSILLTHLLGSLKYLSQFRKIKKVYQDDTISRAILYMKQKLTEQLSLTDIASHCGLSVSHFCLLFKKATSHSPVDYLTFLRMQKACSLLDFTSLKIKEIARSIGYEDPYYFTRVFKKVMGKSPLMYRQHKSG